MHLEDTMPAEMRSAFLWDIEDLVEELSFRIRRFEE
jgi:hypothetical protein